MVVNQIGYTDCYFENFDEYISIGRPACHAQNLIIGTMYVDIDG